MDKKINLGIIFGGQSSEHKVSLLTTKSVISAIDKNKYNITLIGIDRDGTWHLNDNSNFLLNENDPSQVTLITTNRNITLIPYKTKGQLIGLNGEVIETLDVVLPLLHGSFGEDGTIQGLLKLAHLPYVGADVLGSAIAMDKDVTKRLLRDAGLPITKFLTVRKIKSAPSYSELTKELGSPFFIKPANSGSSIGVSKVQSEDELQSALKLAFSHDNKILIEKEIKGREIEFSVLGNEDPIVSLPGEIILNDDFYSYDAKYINSSSSSLKIPAELPKNILEKMQLLTLKAYTTLECEGMARVDMFLTKENEIYINEINTIPGFTQISMYPKLWKASRISYSNLLDRLITLALERNRRDERLLTNK